MNEIRPWVLAETNYGDVKQRQFEVAVIPLGATEPHNLHLPYGTDLFEASEVSQRICQYAHTRGASVVALPTIPYGTETNLREFPLAINLNPSTLHAVLEDIIDSLTDSGIQKIVLLNSHGGNELKPFLREMAGTTPAHLFLCNWYQAIDDLYFDLFQHAEDHAGEMETSFALAYFPNLVAKHDDGTLTADEGKTKPMRFEALNQGWVSITRPWHLLTTNSGAANPHQATADKGRQMMEILEKRLGGFLLELAESEIDNEFPF